MKDEGVGRPSHRAIWLNTALLARATVRRGPREAEDRPGWYGRAPTPWPHPRAMSRRNEPETAALRSQRSDLYRDDLKPVVRKVCQTDVEEGLLDGGLQRAGGFTGVLLDGVESAHRNSL